MSINGPRYEISKIIDGKRYDTSKAKWVYHIGCNLFGDDFKWENTDLYLTLKGRWFLAGRGNAFSRWGRHEADGSYPGSGIRLLTEEEAKTILEEHKGLYEAHFEAEEG